MKKTFMAIALCLVCATTCFGQTWDYIKDVVSIQYEKPIYDKNLNNIGMQMTSRIGCKKDYDIYKKIYEQNTYLKKHIHMPTESVIDNYFIGRNCFTAGKVFISVGAITSFIGTMCLARGLNSKNKHVASYNNTDVITAGYALLGIGSSMISISIPLFCWGDHIKRECNMCISK